MWDIYADEDVSARGYIVRARAMALETLLDIVIDEIIDKDAYAPLRLLNLKRRTLSLLDRNPIEKTRAAKEHAEDIIEAYLEAARKRIGQ